MGERRVVRHRTPPSTLAGVFEPDTPSGAGASPRAPSLLRRLRRLMQRIGIASSVLLLTLPAVAGSVGIVMVVNWISPPPPKFQLYSLALAALVPMTLAPLIGWFILRLMFEAEDARRIAERLAVTDPLTQAFNRRHFFCIGERVFAQAQGDHTEMSVLLLDVDNFKRVNDEHGHAVGDRVLRQVAQTCMDGLREHDLLARFGGEEFVVLLPRTGLVDAAGVAETLRIAVQSLTVEGAGGAVIRPTVSVGVATSAISARSLDALLASADHAMYAAKRSGRNRVITEAVFASADGMQTATTG